MYKVLTAIGVLSLAALFIAFNKMSFLGAECYYVGSFSPEALCFNGTFYKGMIVAALALTAIGGWGIMRGGRSGN